MNVLRHYLLWCLLVVLALWTRTEASAQATAFRFDDLDLRDPHVFVNFIGCRDVTDAALAGFSVNGGLQSAIQTDQDTDGYLDMSYLVEFLPLDQTLTTNMMEAGTARCTAPLATTTCDPIMPPAGLAGDAALSSTTQCLAPIAGTIRPYVPAITSSSAPCFASPTGTIDLQLFGDTVPVRLRDARVAATFVGNPADNLSNGLLMGFVSEVDANNTIVPASAALVGGQSLSSLLPGGNGNCASFSDKDVNGGVVGWWFYLNFPASRVAIVDPFASGFADGFE